MPVYWWVQLQETMYNLEEKKETQYRPSTSDLSRICATIDPTVNEYALYWVENDVLLALCCYSGSTHISAFCAARGYGRHAFNLFMSTGMMRGTIRLESVLYAISFYESLGFTIDDCMYDNEHHYRDIAANRSQWIGTDVCIPMSLYVPIQLPPPPRM